MNPPFFQSIAREDVPALIAALRTVTAERDSAYARGRRDGASEMRKAASAWCRAKVSSIKARIAGYRAGHAADMAIHAAAIRLNALEDANDAIRSLSLPAASPPESSDCAWPVGDTVDPRWPAHGITGPGLWALGAAGVWVLIPGTATNTPGVVKVRTPAEARRAMGSEC